MIDGLLVEVTEVQRGSQATAATAVNGTSIAVENVTDFPEDGGIVDILGNQYTYTAAAADPETVDASGDVTTTGTLTLAAPGVTAAVDIYDPVLLVVGGDVATTLAAVVDIPAGEDSTTPDGGDPVRVQLTRTQRSVFLVGPYDPPVPVTLADDLSTILDTPDVAPTINGAYIDPTTLPPARIPTDPPASSPTLEVQGLTTSLLVKADDVDPTTTIEYHISTTSGFTPGPTTLSIATRATIVAIDELPDTTPLVQGTTYYLVAVATNVAGDATPSPHVSATLTQITKTEIADGSISTPQLAAGAITADIVQGGTFKSAYTLTGTLKVGNISITPGGSGDPGGLLIPLASGGVIQFPADGSDATVQANLHALSATVDDNMMIHGAGNDLAGTLTLDSIPIAPRVAPSVISPLIIDPAALSGTRVTGSIDQNLFSGSLMNDAGGSLFYVYTNTKIYSINKSTGVVATVQSDLSAVMPAGVILASVALIGTSWYVTYQTPNGNWPYRTRVFNPSWVQTADFSLGSAWNNGFVTATGAGSGTLLVAGTHGNGTTVVDSYNATTGALTTSIPLSGNTDGGMPVAVQNGIFDLGGSGNRFVVSYDTGVTRVHDGASGNEITANRFATTQFPFISCCWDGAHFWYLLFSSDDNGNPKTIDVRRLSGQVTSVSRVTKWTQYCDGTRAGSAGAFETKASPSVTTTHRARAYFQVSVPPPADGGGANDPNAVRIYVDSHRQSTLAGTSSRNATYDALNTSNPDSPTTEGFLTAPGLTVGVIQSQTKGTDGNPAFQFKGDGTIKLGGAASLLTALGGVQWGSASLTLSSAASGTVTVPFPKAFNSAPIVLAVVQHSFASVQFVANVVGGTVTASQCQIRVADAAGTARSGSLTINWLAIGGN